MLVLTRKVGESIRIGDDILIVVTGKSGSRTSIGIVAPENTTILRGELEPLVSGGEPPTTDERGDRW